MFLKDSFSNYPVYLIKNTANSVVFQFETVNSILFQIEFENVAHYFDETCQICKKVMSLNFFHNAKFVNFDKKIAFTVVKTIELFVLKFEKPIFFVCESLDNKEFARLKLFKLWNKKFNKLGFLFSTEIVEFSDYKFIYGLISYSWDKNFEQYFKSLETNFFG